MSAPMPSVTGYRESDILFAYNTYSLINGIMRVHASVVCTGGTQVLTHTNNSIYGPPVANISIEQRCLEQRCSNSVRIGGCCPRASSKYSMHNASSRRVRRWMQSLIGRSEPSIDNWRCSQRKKLDGRDLKVELDVRSLVMMMVHSELV